MLRAFVRLLRPTHWVKNVFVLAPVVFAQQLGDLESIHFALLAFACFCLASSSVYVINDLRDRKEDRNHPLKRNRPLAAGTIGVPTASVAAVVLAVAALGIAVSVGTGFAGVVLAYLVINLLYSNGLKHVVIVDVMIIAIGFVLRVLGGGAAIGVEVSAWLLLCTIFVALFLALSKRRHELVLLAQGASTQRRVLTQYSPEFLDQMINVVTASTVVAYALYAISPETAEKFHSELLVYTIPLVLFGIFRYLYLIYQEPSHRNPTEAVVRDVPFLINMAIWAVLVIWIVYFR